MIKILSEDTIQKIAAGEVVEKPASIIKELVENSIDAGSDEIVVQISNGGKTFIRVSDNGHGIEKDQVELAFMRHATSKIEDFNDLYSIYSMGFRGEALASIVSVSNVKIYTKTKDSKAGIHLEYDNNKLVEKKSFGMNQGTIIEVRDLFKYIPARLKFLSSDIAESNKITQLMYSFAIGNRDISFTYIKDDREVFSTNGKVDFKGNIEGLFSKDYVKNSLELESSNQNYTINALASDYTFYRGNRSMQFIFVNGRLVESPEIVKTIEGVYQNSIPTKRYPAFQLFINTDPENIDVNISPNKQKIRFNYFDDLLLQIKESFTKALDDNQRAKTLLHTDSKKEIPSFYDSDDKFSDLINKYRADIKPSNTSGLYNKADLFQESVQKDEKKDIKVDDKVTEDIEDDFIVLTDNDFDLDSYINKYSINDEDLDQQITYVAEAEEFQIVNVIFNKYLVLENGSNTIKLVDLKRAEQRLLYDKLSSTIASKSNVYNDLISPYIVSLNKKDMDIYLQNTELFRNFGYIIDLLGDKDLAIRSVPYLGNEPANKDLFFELLDSLNTSFEENLLEDRMKKTVVSSLSKQNKIYNIDAASSIYHNLLSSDDKFKNPFGKNIILEVTNKDIERLFDKW